jgi:zinc transport system substrate-binding protein
MIAADPNNGTYYQSNCDELVGRLIDLNDDFVNGLENRTKNTIITTHEGFDYMAMRYNFTAYGVVGISGDEQASAQDIADLTDLVKELDLKYVYAEPLFSDTMMKQISAETGAEVLILDGIHGRSGAHADMDYFEIMYENLKNLQIGLEVTE